MLEKVYHLGWALRINKLIPLPACSISCLHDLNFLLPPPCLPRAYHFHLRQSSIPQTLLDVALVNGILVIATEQQLPEQVTVLAKQTWVPEFHSWNRCKKAGCGGSHMESQHAYSMMKGRQRLTKKVMGQAGTHSMEQVRPCLSKGNREN